MHEIEKIDNKTESIEKNQIKILRLKSKGTEIKPHWRGSKNIHELAEERISKLEDRAKEIMILEHREKRMKKTNRALDKCEAQLSNT